MLESMFIKTPIVSSKNLPISAALNKYPTEDIFKHVTIQIHRFVHESTMDTSIYFSNNLTQPTHKCRIFSYNTADSNLGPLETVTSP